VTAEKESNRSRALTLRSASIGFFILNTLGYITYYLYPAAPPWYADLNGLHPLSSHAVAHTVPNAAGALAFDQWVGLEIFSKMYGMSADVFGAVPSLHIAYPALILTLALRTRRGVGISLVYFVGMVFSAIYLNHHYIFDALWGVIYGVAVGQICERLLSGASFVLSGKKSGLSKKRGVSPGPQAGT